ncbi:hypothetical protein CRG98_040609 [Punica granatum]|uniref:Reverse transcriptase Ty1/copia-type domain-containing protein n=1 Tax=Punica granatum TaxID=22663 RepID=A0A2I0I4W9_PUNGR|nr:hypothetical protein CRG98_040609 [Punica granatum]
MAKCLSLELRYSLRKSLSSKEQVGGNYDLGKFYHKMTLTNRRVTQEPRRSGRIRHEPERYGFLMTQDNDVLFVDNDKPTTYAEAVTGPDSEKWLDVMRSEMESMYTNQVWTLVDPPEGVKPIRCKWVFKKKTDVDGNVITFKGRLVAKDFKQVHGVDYDETFSPMAMLKSIRILLAITAYYDYEIWQMDVKTAFLNGRLLEDVYMTQPEGFVDPQSAGKVCERHWIAVKNILKYLRRTKEMFLVYGGEEELVVRGYTDASFQSDKDDSRSQSGYVFCLNEGAVSWKRSKQETVADSTTEAEYIAASNAAKEAVWIKKFVTELIVVMDVETLSHTTGIH